MVLMKMQLSLNCMFYKSLKRIDSINTEVKTIRKVYINNLLT